MHNTAATGKPSIEPQSLSGCRDGVFVPQPGWCQKVTKVMRPKTLWAGRSGLLAGALEELPLIHGGWNGYVEKADHHFIGGLVSPDDGFPRVRVMRIVG